MTNSKERNTVLVVGVVAGAVLMALVIMMVFALGTGVAGAVLAVLIVAVSAFTGWIIGLNQRIAKRNYYSYMKGYREGAEEYTLVVKFPNQNFKFRIQDFIKV